MMVVTKRLHMHEQEEDEDLMNGQIDDRHHPKAQNALPIEALHREMGNRKANE